MSLSDIKITDGIFIYKHQKFQQFIGLDRCSLIIERPKDKKEKDKNVKIKAKLIDDET